MLFFMNPVSFDEWFNERKRIIQHPWLQRSLHPLLVNLCKGTQNSQQ